MSTIVKVGPKGYEHGWIFVGVPGIGMHVHHPKHGRGTVSHIGEKKIGVHFDNGHRSEFSHVKKPGPGHLEPRSAPAHGPSMAKPKPLHPTPERAQPKPPEPGRPLVDQYRDYLKANMHHGIWPDVNMILARADRGKRTQDEVSRSLYGLANTLEAANRGDEGADAIRRLARQLRAARKPSAKKSVDGEQVKHLLLLAKSANRLLAENAERALDRLLSD